MSVAAKAPKMLDGTVLGRTSTHKYLKVDGNLPEDSSNITLPADVISSSRQSISDALQICICILAWWASALFVILKVKTILSGINGEVALFPYPFCQTGLVNLFVGLLAFMYICATHIFCASGELVAPAMSRNEYALLFAAGILNGIEFGTYNHALSFISVSSRSMFGQTGVIFMMCTAWCWGLDVISLFHCIAGVFIVTGGIAQSSSGANLVEHFGGAVGAGLVMVTLSNLLGAQRWAMLQYGMQRLPQTSALPRLSKLKMLAFMQPGFVSGCFVLASVFEPGSAELLARNAARLLREEATLAVCILVLVVAELHLVHKTSAVMMTVLQSVKDVPIVLGGVFLHGDSVSSSQAYGFVLCLLGVGVYLRTKLSSQVVVGDDDN